MFRFQIRDLLWLTAIAAVLVAWWADRQAAARQRQEIVASAEKLREALLRAKLAYDMRTQNFEDALQIRVVQGHHGNFSWANPRPPDWNIINTPIPSK